MAATTSKSLPIQSKDANSGSEPTTNPRGIPVFPFMTSVTDYVKTPSDTEAVLTRFQEMISKYQFMQQNVERRAAGLREKLPEMKRTLDVVKFLRKQKAKPSSSSSSEDDDEDDDDDDEEEETSPSKPTTQHLQTTFQLQDTLYAHASIDTHKLDEVYLWLGANVMVAYPLPEAEELLQGKLDKARESLRAAEEDLEFLRVQVTTLEVAVARVHNWDVAEKRKLKAAGGADGKQGGKGKGDDGGDERGGA